MTSKDEMKRHTKGFRDRGVCPCCRETTKREAVRLARRRIKQQDREEMKRGER